jgi:phosphopantetheinyl transferase
MNDVLVLHCALRGTVSPPVMASLLRALPYAYRLELERRSESARIASLAGIALLLEAVRRVRGAVPGLRLLRVPADGKPTFLDGPSFSIAHSSTRVAVAVGESCELGLDVEEEGAGGRTARELERWTATEAALKAMGGGLRELHAVHLDDDLAGARLQGTRLHLHSVNLVERCVARLASAAVVSVVTVEEVGWPL